MMLYSHLVVATFGYAVFVDWESNGKWGEPGNIALGWIFVCVGCFLPDIDCPKSTIGRRVRFLSYPINWLFGHRGLTHSAIAVGLIGYLNQMLNSNFVTWIMIGYVLHLAGDFLTPSGIPLAWPWKRRFRFILVAETNTYNEIILVLIFVIISIWYISS